MPEIPSGPLPDVRPPTFAKGQSFGPIPHRRLVMIANPAEPPWDWVERGVLMDFIGSGGPNPNATNHSWYAWWEYEGNRWDMIFSWVTAATATFTVEYQVLVINDAVPEAFATYESLEVNKHVGTNKIIALQSNHGTGVPPSEFQKIEVPEWSTPADRWPSLIIAKLL